MTFKTAAPRFILEAEDRSCPSLAISCSLSRLEMLRRQCQDIAVEPGSERDEKHPLIRL
jgi:hypothetical protein